MNLRRPTTIKSIALALTIPLILMFFVADAECAQGGQKSSEELLLEIMDLHSELVTNETFLAQAKMLGAYLEAAQPLKEAKKINIYKKVLDILVKVRESGRRVPTTSTQQQGKVEQKTLEGDQEGKSVYEPGAALLEIFKVNESYPEIPELPVIRIYWKRDLTYSGKFLLPERLSEIGDSLPYVAKFSFYYEAKQTGKYGFTILHNRVNSCRLAIGDAEIVKAVGMIDSKERTRTRGSSVAQGVCTLAKGFHRVDFRLISVTRYNFEDTGSFEVKVFAPGTFDAVPLTKDMMLLKKE